jgi:hypothetical protein
MDQPQVEEPTAAATTGGASMYAHQHAAVSVAATFTVAWAAGVSPPWSVVGWTVLGGTLIDVIDHPLYQLTYGRRQGILADAWRTVRRDGLRRGLAVIMQAEDSRTFDRLFLHNVNGLIASLAASAVIAIFWPVPGLLAVAFGWLLHMLSDITWDFKNVGHARNWFSRRAMPWKPDSPTAVWLARNWYLVWGLIIFAVGVVGLRLAVALRTAAHLPRVGALGHLTALMVLLITGQLVGLATAVWRHSVSMRAATGARPALAIRWPAPEDPSWAASRRLAAARIFRHDHLILAGCLAGTMAAVLIIWTWLRPGLFIHQHQAPAAVVLAVPLGLMICAGVFGHTSAAAVGGLLGVVISVIGERLLSHAGLIRAWGSPTALGIVAAGLAAWVFSLLLGRWSGRIQASSMLVAVTPAARSPRDTLSPGLDEPGGVGIEELDAVFRKACQEALGGRPTWAAPTWPQAADTDFWGVTPSRDVLVFTDEVRVRLRASHRPRCVEDDAVFHQTFCNPSESQPPLMPRSWAGASAPHARVDSGKLGWVGSYQGPALDTARPDGTTLHKTLSEITDNLLTRQSDLIVDVCRIRDDRGSLFAVISREQTSTKSYGTPQAEHVGLVVAEYMANRTSGRAAAARISSSAYSGEHPLGFAGGWTPAIAVDGQESDLARAATLLSQDFQAQTTRLVAQRLLFAVIQIVSLLPLVQLIAKP